MPAVGMGRRCARSLRFSSHLARRCGGAAGRGETVARVLGLQPDDATALAPERLKPIASRRRPGVGLDAAEMMLQLQDAEKSGVQERLPALYLSLARCRLAEGEAEEAEELLRKSIRGGRRSS